MAEIVTAVLPEEKPRYLMGVGTPANLLECIGLGIDMFDCVMPTRNARHGMLFTSEGIINIKNKKWEMDFSPLDPNGTSEVDHVYSKAYLRHLVKSRSIWLFKLRRFTIWPFIYGWSIRQEKIIDGTFRSWKESMLPKLRNRL